jgi:hypothetical protein
MRKILIICIVLAAGWYGNKLYKNNELPFVQPSSSSVSIDDKIKCITKEGRILYGKVPDDVVCERHESIKASIVILSSDKNKKESSKKNNDVSSGRQCDGRTYCSQMTSRAEAEFFINNCSNTKMDGDYDGVPCEGDSRF